MVEDAPEDDVQDMLYENSLRAVRCQIYSRDARKVSMRSYDDIKNYIAREYASNNIVVSVAGNFDADQICQQFEHSLSCMTASKEDKSMSRRSIFRLSARR